MDFEGVDSTEVPTIYRCVDGILTERFAHPPAPEAQLEVPFSYSGYRVTIDLNGNAKFVKTG
ncbi:HalOD1 output domain-containing protein [Natrialbaceae archaeon GCM10025810]